ncbi:MAG: acetolactate synthase [Phycisphaerae bacterium]|mgnify:CR=1 FL=1|nr:acetolactate synthase [Phycisphaerae bacterium]
MGMVPGPYETLEGQGYPIARQLSVFLENRVGQLLRLTQLIDTHEVRILGLSVIDSVDCAVVRLLFDAPDLAKEILAKAGFSVSVAEVIVVKLPAGKQGLLLVWQCLLSCEINIGYCYPLLPEQIGPALALSVDNIEMAADVLIRNHFEVLGEADLKLDY